MVADNLRKSNCNGEISKSFFDKDLAFGRQVCGILFVAESAQAFVWKFRFITAAAFTPLIHSAILHVKHPVAHFGQLLVMGHDKESLVKLIPQVEEQLVKFTGIT